MNSKNTGLLHLIAYSTTLVVAVLLSGCKHQAVSMAGPYKLRYPEGLTLQEVIQVLKSPPLNLEIGKTEGGTIVTGPKTYEGREAGFLWWKKKYEERTTFIIKLTTSFEQGTVFVEVDAHTEERPNPNYPWEKIETPKDEERAIDVLNYLAEKLEVTHGS